MLFIRKYFLSIFILGAFLPAATMAQATLFNRAISDVDVLAAQQAWCNALIKISEEGKKIRRLQRH